MSVAPQNSAQPPHKDPHEDPVEDTRDDLHEDPDENLDEDPDETPEEESDAETNDNPDDEAVDEDRPTFPARRGKVRLQRVLADAGVAARRVCEQMIEEGRVTVNGEMRTRLPIFVDPENDDIKVDNRSIPKPERHIYVMVHKPARVMVTTADEPGLDRTTILSLVDHPAKARLFPVGRLDFNTTGLVLLTNDGDLAHRLTHPRYEIAKTYLAMVKGTPDAGAIATLNKKLKKHDERKAREKFGRKARIEAIAEVAIRGQSRPQVRVVQADAEKSLVEITLVEARNGQIEDVLASLGSPVKKLARVAFGPLVMKGLAVGRWRELTRDELILLRRAAEGTGPKRASPPGAERTRSGPPPNRRPAAAPVRRSTRATDALRASQQARGDRPGAKFVPPVDRSDKPRDWTWRAAGGGRAKPGQKQRDLRRAGKLPPRIPKPKKAPTDDDSRPRFNPQKLSNDRPPTRRQKRPQNGPPQRPQPRAPQRGRNRRDSDE
jgi:23S rRNA pseudouridine2605 synthase